MENKVIMQKRVIILSIKDTDKRPKAKIYCDGLLKK
jgi:hypothetical protein